MSRAKAGANPALPFFLQNGPSRFFQCDSGTVNKLNLYCAETRCVCELIRCLKLPLRHQQVFMIKCHNDVDEATSHFIVFSFFIIYDINNVTTKFSFAS